MGHHGNIFTSFGVTGAVGGWVELARTTLVGTASNVTVSGLPNKRYYMILRSTIPTGQIDIDMRFNSDSGNNYARRFNSAGGSDATGTSTTFLNSYNQGGAQVPLFCVEYVANLAANEKLVIGHLINQSVVGASTAPGRVEEVAKWVNTSDSIDEVEMNEARAGSYDTDTEIVVLGWDPADVHTTNFWEELAHVDLSGGAAATLSSGTITAKKYLWVQYYIDRTTTDQPFMTFNGDSGSNYADRINLNGETDSTNVSQSSFQIGNAAVANLPQFGNMFIINNSANEKLVIQHTVAVNGVGAGTAPRRVEMVSKWDNTASQITELTLGAASGNYDSITEMIIWGSD